MKLIACFLTLLSLTGRIDCLISPCHEKNILVKYCCNGILADLSILLFQKLPTGQSHDNNQLFLGQPCYKKAYPQQNL